MSKATLPQRKKIAVRVAGPVRLTAAASTVYENGCPNIPDLPDWPPF